MSICRSVSCWVLLLASLAACGGGGSGTAAVLGPVRGAGGGLADMARAVACHVDGSLTVVGTFSGAATFGAGTPTETTLVSEGATDLFIARYDSAMDLVWVRQGAGTSHGTATGVAAGPEGSCVVVGTFTDEITLVTPTALQTLSSAGAADQDGFVACYLADGSLSWVSRIHGTDGQHVSGVSSAPDGSTYVTGGMVGTTVFGANEPGETSIPSFSASPDAFLARYGPSGLLMWATSAGGTAGDVAAAVAADPAGGVVIAGSFEDQAVFGFFEQNSTLLTSGGYRDAFVARYGADGSLVWARSAGGTQPVRAEGIGVLSDGSVAVTGRFQGTAVFGAGTTPEQTLHGTGVWNLFVGRYLADGGLAWAGRASSTGEVVGHAVAIGMNDEIFVTGAMDQLVTFAPGQLTATTMDTGVFSEVFLARYNSLGSMLWVRRAGGGSVDVAYGAGRTPWGGVAVVGEFHETSTWGAGAPDASSLTAEGGGDAFIARYDPDGFLD